MAQSNTVEIKIKIDGQQAIAATGAQGRSSATDFVEANVKKNGLRLAVHCDLVGPPRVELGTNGLCVPRQLSLPVSGLWSGLSLVFTTYPYSLYTFQTSLPGLARDYHAANSRGFPDFE